MGILDWLFGQKTWKVTAAADPSFRITIEDVFTIRGACVVVGQIERGTFKVGNEVHLIKGQGAIKEVVVYRHRDVQEGVEHCQSR